MSGSSAADPTHGPPDGSGAGGVGGTGDGGSRPAARTNQPFEVAGSVSVVTGGASGIGVALVRALHRSGAAVVVIADLDGQRASAVAAHVADEVAAQAGGPGGGGPGVRGTVEGTRLDVTDAVATQDLVNQLRRRHGEIDLWCANAGIGTGAGVEAEPDLWRAVFEVNTLAHVHAARALLPAWRARGRGHLMVTASAAGLLTNLGDAAYSVTKHGAVAFAEWLAITHGAEGIGVTALCPQGVRTPLLFGAAADEFAHLETGRTAGGGLDPGGALAARVVKAQRIIEPEDVAASAMAGLADGRFLVLPHEEVAGYEQARAADHDRWIRSMRRLQAFLTQGDADTTDATEGDAGEAGPGSGPDPDPA